MLERAGRPFPREDVSPACAHALAGAGAPADADVELLGFTAPPVPAGARRGAEVGQLDYDAGSGRFTADARGGGRDGAAEPRLSAGWVMLELPVAGARGRWPGEA